MMSDDHRLGWNHVMNRGALEQKRNEVACTRLPWQSLGNKLNIHISYSLYADNGSSLK